MGRSTKVTKYKGTKSKKEGEGFRNDNSLMRLFWERWREGCTQWKVEGTADKEGVAEETDGLQLEERTE